MCFKNLVDCMLAGFLCEIKVVRRMDHLDPSASVAVVAAVLRAFASASAVVASSSVVVVVVVASFLASSAAVVASSVVVSVDRDVAAV